MTDFGLRNVEFVITGCHIQPRSTPYVSL